MEIQKIYTSLGEDERLFSVLLSEEELHLFQKEFAGSVKRANKAAKRIWEMKNSGLSEFVSDGMGKTIKRAESDMVKLGRAKLRKGDTKYILDHEHNIRGMDTPLNNRINSRGFIEKNGGSFESFMENQHGAYWRDELGRGGVKKAKQAWKDHSGLMRTEKSGLRLNQKRRDY